MPQLQLTRSRIRPATGGLRFQPSNVRGLRAASYKPKSWDASSRTFEAVMASETPCRTFRWTKDWDLVEVDEILPMSALKDIRSLRGRPILDAHQSWSTSHILGAIRDAWIDGDKLVFRGELSDRDDVAGVVRDIERGIINSFSVGFDILEDGRVRSQGDDKNPIVKVKAWKAYEVSAVPIPADDTAKIRSRGATPNLSLSNGTSEMDSATFKKRASKSLEAFLDELVDMFADDTDDEDDDEDAGNGSGSRGKTDLSPAAKAAKVRGFREIFKKRGLADEFKALEASDADVEIYQTMLANAVKTSGASIDAGKGVDDGTDGQRGKLRSGRESKKLGLTK